MESLRRPYPRQQQHSRQQQALPPADEDLLQDEEEDDEDAGGDVWPQRLPSSARRYQGVTTEDVPRRAAAVGGRAATPIPRRRSAPPPATVGGRPQRLLPARAQSQEEAEEEAAAYQRGGRRRVHWLVVVVMALGTKLVGWVLLTLLSTWGQVTWDDLHYGRPRTFQCDAVVGHNDSVANPSHFIALNLHHQVEIIEFPGGDSTHAKIYLGPILAGPGQDLIPVTLSFRDVNGDGKPDMLITIQGSQIVFLNDHGQFRPLKAGEHVHL